MRKFRNAHEAVAWLDYHPMFNDQHGLHGLSRFNSCLSWYIVMTDPKTKKIMDDKSRNTRQRVWIECGPWINDEPDLPEGYPHHDIRLDLGADTFEDALIKLARKVLKYYGDYIPKRTRR